ncbi:MAG TPA: protein-arginine deiminase family protein [Candidatus Rifleibacterium sp.]|nr:protein-arginine deiminase family protein [Candidatus Rifleibacterium sp.]HPT46725.1 protein-arginine deiminase family protein [Candidatus Rifleibacterium sp.]
MQHRSTCELLLLAVIIVSLLFPAFADARQRELAQENLERVRILGPNNVPIKVLVVYNPEKTRQFVVDLIKIVASINAQDKPPATERLKVHVVLSAQKDRATLEKDVSAAVMKDLVEVNDKFFTTDQWMQDWGEVATIKLKNNPKQQLAVIDSNRGRGIAALPAILANFWNCYLLKNPSEARSAGDYGGNIEVTPDDILIVGNTISNEFRDFFYDRGYAEHMVKVETDWLKVGHCDEYLSIVPNPKASTGYTIVKANPRLALRLIKDSPRADLEKIEIPEYRTMMLAVHDYLNAAVGPGNSFQNRALRHLEGIDNNGNPQSNLTPTTRDSAATEKPLDPTRALAEEFVRMNLALAVVIDSNIKTVTRKIERVNQPNKFYHSIISFPVVYHFNLGYIAYVPGVVNQLILRKHLIIPDPKIKAFSDYIDRVAGKVGLVAHFIDDMPYHTLQGEIHCGTNVLRHPNRYVVRPKFLPPELAPKD